MLQCDAYCYGRNVYVGSVLLLGALHRLVAFVLVGILMRPHPNVKDVIGEGKVNYSSG